MSGVKLTFKFTPRLSLKETPLDERVSTSILLPMAVTEQADLRDQILTIATHAAYFTEYSMFVHCAEAGLRDHPIVQQEKKSHRDAMNALCLYFEGITNSGHYLKKSRLYFYAPIVDPFSRHSRSSLPLNHTYRSPEQQDYVQHLRAFVDPLLKLLNSTGDTMACHAFDPRQWQNWQATRSNKAGAKYRRELAAKERQQKRLADKLAKQAEKAAAEGVNDVPETHGAGRMPGARPGIYKGVQMRSQLEIYFAAELDEREIKWFYEGKALGEAQYLVDFYLPDLGVWVEVKGLMTAKDRQVLPEVARTLKTERKERLLIYSGSGKCSAVNPSGFREFERKNFWAEVMK